MVERVEWLGISQTIRGPFNTGFGFTVENDSLYRLCLYMLD